ncbi:MAG: acyltransferase family protein [Proteobacteria bacterium]|nr:acyltransferase family protein [Pseudomonadota bacterium]
MAAGRLAEHHIAGLDGLRAIAVLAVLLFHADLYWARGGYLGVDLFFVISGFLITGLLANEVEASGKLDIKQFYWRRAKRLLPAVWLMMAAVLVVVSRLAVDALPRLRSDALASVFYVTNWELLWVHVSYFEGMGRPPLLQHLWSLAIEEQYYIVWAMAVPLGLRLVSRRWLIVIAIGLAALSAAWMAMLAVHIGYPDRGDASRLYFGTDTHGFPLLLGSALGLAWRPERISWLLPPFARTFLWIAGVLALAAFAALVVELGEQTRWLYPWGFLLAAGVAASLITIGSHPVLAFGRLLDAGPMRWIGNRSYGIYLWHWPVYMLTRPGIDLRAWNANQALALRLALSIGIAALSYRLVEMPIRRGALERGWRWWRALAERRKAERLAVAHKANPPTRAHRRGWRTATAGGLAVLAVASATTLIWRAHGHAPWPALGRRGADVRPRAKSPPRVASIAPTVLPAPSAIPILTPVQAPVEIEHPGTPPVVSYAGRDLTAVGDSVLLGSSQLLGITLHGVDIHATVGWQAADVLAQLRDLREHKKLRAVVLIHLGTNGYVYEEQLRQILATVKDCQRVVLVNSHVPRRWMEANNQLIDRLAPQFPNVVVVRWSDVSEGQPDYFVADGVHLTDRGQRAYIGQIMRVGHLLPDPTKAPNEAAIDPTRNYATGAGDAAASLVLAPREAAPDSYWKKMAQCESDTVWTRPGPRSGGLAITLADWLRYGGFTFARTPGEATPAQQIEIANRISTQGWKLADGVVVAPEGFAGWRCVAALPPPRTKTDAGSATTFTSQSVLAQSFHLGERGEVVRDLQLIIGTPRDGIYSKATRKKHLAYLQENHLPIERAGTAQ